MVKRERTFATHPMLDEDAVAERLNVSPSTVKQWRWLSKGPRWVRVGRHIRYDAADLEAWLDAGGDEPNQARPA